VDSYGPHRESWQRAAAEHGIAMSDEAFAATFGRTSREIIAQFWGASVDDARARAIDDRKEALYRELVRERFPAMHGAVALVRALAAEGFALAVGSSGPLENVQLSLEELGCGELFGAVVTGRDVERGKPDPQVFQLAAERLGVAPPHCVVVEDAPAGVAAARAAGMRVVALLGTADAAALGEADLVVSRLSELDAGRLAALLASGRR